ncbi:MAG: hypothetical protein GC182_03065 [Rhodopseudomonas sp.]|nr:hypothetical protein [Rhodopseudomonas sp.]
MNAARMKTLTLIAGCMLVASSVVGTEVQKHLGFRAYMLGMTEDEFKATSHPDAGQPWMTGLGNLISLCSGDRLPRGAKIFGGDHLASTPEYRKAAISRCAYFYRRGNFLYEVGVGIGAKGEAQFLFRKKHLYLIYVRFPEPLFEDVVAGLKVKYGAPDADTAGIVQNGFGAKAASRALQWKLSDETATLLQRGSRFNEAALSILDKAANMQAQEALRIARGIGEKL